MAKYLEMTAEVEFDLSAIFGKKTEKPKIPKEEQDIEPSISEVQEEKKI